MCLPDSCRAPIGGNFECRRFQWSAAGRPGVLSRRFERAWLPISARPDEWFVSKPQNRAIKLSVSNLFWKVFLLGRWWPADWLSATLNAVLRPWQCWLNDVYAVTNGDSFVTVHRNFQATGKSVVPDNVKFETVQRKLSVWRISYPNWSA